MGPRSRVRAAKCQMLVTSVFVLLLGLSVATMAVLTYFGAHSTVISFTSLESNPYKATHCWAFYTGMSLAGLLTLGATLSAAATVREAQGLMAGGFLSFALGFCILAQVAFWRSRNPTQVEDAALDTYDLVYEQAVKTASLVWQQELAAIQDTARDHQCPEASQALQPAGSQCGFTGDPRSGLLASGRPLARAPMPSGWCSLRNNGCTLGPSPGPYLGPLSLWSLFPRGFHLLPVVSRSNGGSHLSALVVSVLWEEVSFRPSWGRGSQSVPGRGGSKRGLPAEHPEPPEAAPARPLHPEWHRPGPHGHVTGSPRSPASSDAPRVDAHLDFPLEQTLLVTTGV
ncbi:tetraspanin-32 isoform X2 [Nycticebus coucang]|uniref:tetraspanin-32 isoform X2 n=1 Tax=Nycticebus coucang TaxID=9470 RepID=UPI00234C3183|nr:tetraspanin-32 isoform X2 [Nycticebus coucang]